VDLIGLIEPFMTSSAIYGWVAGFAAGDVLFPVIPSEGAVIAAGVFAASTGVPNLPLVMLVAALGAFAGDHVAYALGRSALGPRLVRRWPRLAKPVAAVARQLDRRGGTLIVASRFVPGGRTAVTLAAGLTAYPPARFSKAAALAASLWAMYCGLIGLVGGAAFAANPVMGIAVGIGLSLAITLLVEVVRKMAASRSTPVSLGENRSVESAGVPNRAATGHG
jgi:membrane-associated protein